MAETAKAKPGVVRVTFRGHHVYLLPERTTDQASLVKEAVHFDRAITSWEKWGTFETLTSMHGRFVVQYDKTNVVAGIPRAVIGTTETFLSIVTNEEDSLAQRPEQPRTQLGTPACSLGDRNLAALNSPVAPRAKETCRGTTSDHTATDTDDEDNDDDDDDEPPDWSEYENANLTAGYEELEARSDGKPDEILDTRVTFCQIDLIPADEYEALYESEDAPPPPRNYLIRGEPVPEMVG